jgi:hypothetical protein
MSCLHLSTTTDSKEECRQEKAKQEIPKRRASLYQEPTHKIQPYAQVAASFPCSYTCINNQKSIPTVIQYPFLLHHKTNICQLGRIQQSVCDYENSGDLNWVERKNWQT